MTAHQKLLSIWSLSEFGVKTRVFNHYSPQIIEYILKHPKYQNTDKINDIIQCVKDCTDDLLEEVNEMYNQIESI
jgi:peptidyl-tRNA hydrolase